MSCLKFKTTHKTTYRLAMKNFKTLILFATLLLCSVSAFSQSVVATYKFDSDAQPNKYILPKQKLLVLNLYKDKKSLVAKIQIFDKDLSIFSEEFVQLGEEDIHSHNIGHLSADSSKFHLIKYNFYDKYVEVATFDFKNYEVNITKYPFPEKLEVAKPEFYTPIYTSDHIYFLSTSKNFKKKLLLWQIDLKSYETHLEPLPNCESYSDLNSLYTWKDNTLFLCYKTSQNKEETTFNFVNLIQGGSMQNMYSSTNIETGINLMSIDFFDVGNHNYYATGSCGINDKTTNAIYFIGINKNHQISPMRRLFLCDIPKFENAVQFKPIEDTKEEYPGTEKSYRSCAFASAFIKTKEGFILNYRMVGIGKGLQNGYDSHEQILKVNNDFELIEAQFIQYEKTQSFILHDPVFNRINDNKIIISNYNPDQIKFQTLEGNVLSETNSIEYAAIDSKVKMTYMFTLEHWYGDVYLLSYNTRPNYAFYSIQFDK